MSWNGIEILLRATLIHGLGILLIASCAAPTGRERIEERRASAKPKGAAYAAEGFMMDWRSPEPRANGGWDFYFKHCTLDDRNPYPKRSDWDCTGPQ